MSEEIVEMHAIVHGHVQGVCFRATTRDHAKQLHIAGTVKNMPDGTVEIYAQGDKDQLKTFLERIKKDASPGKVDSIVTHYYKPNQNFNSFSVIF